MLQTLVGIADYKIDKLVIIKICQKHFQLTLFSAPEFASQVLSGECTGK